VTNYPERVKAFWLYTGLRLLLFAASFGVVFSAWLLIAGEANLLIAIVIAFVISGIGSYFLLERQRQALAVHVEDRAARASARFDEMKSKEDVD
jgi:hypothetical protein